MRTLKTAAMALALPGILATSIPASAAVAGHTQLAADSSHSEVWQQWRDRRDRRDRYERYDRYDGDRYGRNQRYYDEPVYQNTRVWRGNDGRYHCRKKNGTTGLIIGAAGGALLGREIAGRGDNTLGAILGGVGGALLGREVDRGGSRCR